MRRVALLLLVPAAAGCVPNPYYQDPPAEGASEGATTTTTAATTEGSGTSTSGEPTTAGETAGTSAATTGTTGTTGTTTTAADTGTDSDITSSGTGGCDVMEELVLQGGDQVDDAFFLVNIDPQVSACLLYEVSFMDAPCGTLNAGGSDAMKIRRTADGDEVMFAIRFALGDAYQDLLGQGAQIVGARLSMTLYELSDDVDIRVGRIAKDQLWKPGDGYGSPAFGDEATFDLRVNGDMPEYWAGQDGPRGASTSLCDFHVDAGDYMDHPRRTVCDFDPSGVEMLADGGGLVLYLDKGPDPIYGPGLKATGSTPEYEPDLTIYYCPP